MTAVSLVEFIILLGSITAVAIGANFLRLPTIVAFILSGVAVGPHGIALIESPPDAGFMAEIVAIFLMFTIGLEFSFRKLKTFKREFIHLGTFQVLITSSLIALLAHLSLEVTLSKAIFFGFLVALSSTALVLKLLYDQREMETPHGRNSIGILLFQDVAVIPMMLLLPVLAGSGASVSSSPLSDMLKTVVAVSGIIFASRFLMPLIMEKVARVGSREIFFFFVLFICLGAAAIFHHLGLSLSLGAFAAGMLISESPYGRQATSEILPLRDNFLGLLFAIIGMLLDLNFLWNHILWILILGILLFVTKLLVTALVCLFWKSPAQFSIITALSICQIGEFSFILAASGLKLELLSATEHQYFLSISILSMLFTPFLFKVAPRLSTRSPEQWASLMTLGKLKIKERNRPLPQSQTNPVNAEEKKSHALLIGFGIANQNLAHAFGSLELPYAVIEANYDSVKKFKAKGFPIQFGDASQTEVLEHAGIENTNLVVIAISGARLIPAIIAAVRRLRPDVPIVVRAQYIQDVSHFNQITGLEIVVAEVETSIELLARVLKSYGVSSEEIQNYMAQAKSQLLAFSNLTSQLEGSNLNLPSWEALGAIRPIRISRGFFCISKALSELDLRRSTGASIVSVYRIGSGTIVPKADFMLLEGDVVHLVGDPMALRAASEKLKTGQDL